MQVGDVVVAVGDFILHCGSGIYSHAICASVKPLILVSEQGDMLWRATVHSGNVRALCQAHPDIVKVALARLRQDGLAKNQTPKG